MGEAPAPAVGFPALPSPAMWKRVLLVPVLLGLWLLGFPLRQVSLLEVVHQALGSPDYAGPWVLVDDLAVAAAPFTLVMLLAWALLSWRGWAPRLGASFAVKPWVVVSRWALVGALLLIAIEVPAALVAGARLEFHPADGWTVAGSLLTGGAEELVWRGLFFGGASVIFQRRWAGALVATLLSLPFRLRPEAQAVEAVAVLLSGAALCLTAVRGRSLWAPALAHPVAKAVIDTLL